MRDIIEPTFPDCSTELLGFGQHAVPEEDCGLVNGPITFLDIEPALATAALRTLSGKTSLDRKVEDMCLPKKPLWLRGCILALRCYRRVRPESIGNRCRFDPSCSRYAELAFRRHGFFRGCFCVTTRLSRCRPGRGGLDLP